MGDTMLIDAQIVTPYLIIILTAALGLAGFYFKSITNKLAHLSESLMDLALKMAVIIEHTKDTDTDILDVKKYHNEIIDLKVATAELNERSLNNRSAIHSVQSRLDDTRERL